MSTCVAREHHQYFIIEVSVTFRSSYKIFAARLPARETQHYSTSSAHLVWKTYPICLAETPPPKISRFKPCLLAKYAVDHLNTSLLGSSGNALLLSTFFLAIFCTAVQIRLRIRHSAPKLYPMHQRNKVSARPEQTCISSRGQIFSCFAPLYISNMPNKIFFGHFLREFLEIFFSIFAAQYMDFYRDIFLHICIANLKFFNHERRMYYEYICKWRTR